MYETLQKFQSMKVTKVISVRFKEKTLKDNLTIITKSLLVVSLEKLAMSLQKYLENATSLAWFFECWAFTFTFYSSRANECLELLMKTVRSDSHPTKSCRCEATSYVLLCPSVYSSGKNCWQAGHLSLFGDLVPMTFKYFIYQVRPFEKDVERRYSAGGGLITQHINSMLEAAYRYDCRVDVRL